MQGISTWSRTRYIVVFNYGAIVLFNFGINEECDCLDVIRQHCSEQCQEAKKDGTRFPDVVFLISYSPSFIRKEICGLKFQLVICSMYSGHCSSHSGIVATGTQWNCLAHMS